MEINKPLIYLDHNIYDSFTKNELQELKTSIHESFQVAYSDENLKEIARSPEYSDSFLKVLSELNAYYMEIVLDKNWNITDRMRFYNTSPQIAYNEQLKNTRDFGSINFDQFLHKLLGGRDTSSYNEIIGEIQNSLDSMLDGLDTYDNIFNFGVSHLRKDAHHTFEQLKAQIDETIPNDIKFNATNALRQEAGTGPVVLNNIQGSGTLQRILEGVKSLPEMANVLKVLLGLDKEEALKLINPSRSLCQTICGLYTFLEILGYWSDRRLKHEHRFSAFLSDQYHAANAIFTKAILTRDRQLAMKAGAIYEYLGIGTKVVYISIG
jgi:hypothetical protein